MRAKRRILILDDETKVAFFLQESLEALGHDFEVVTVSSSDEALEEASRAKFDLLVTDQRLPSMNGLDLIERIQKLHPDTPFILITAYSTEDVLAKAQRLGAYRYFTKPFRIEDFVQSVVDALENGDGRPKELLLDRPADVLSDRLEELRREVGAQCVLASNTDGALVAQAGALVELDAEQLLESAANDFSTSVAMAQFLGGTQGGHLTYYEGATHDVYLANVKDDLFLAIIFDRRMQASRIGIVWLYARRAIDNLRRVWSSIPLELAVD
jgi:CheY-like chemotaxis protein/predicted regulator of Ras-like GTPase activity (Roadblock/LC7/MglB family)